MNTKVDALFFFGGVFVLILTVIRVMFHYDPVEVILYIAFAIACFYLAYRKSKEKNS